LDLPSQAIRLALALWVGGTLVAVLAAPAIFRTVPSRDLAGAVFGEILRRFEAVKQVLSLILVLGVFVNLERGAGLSGRSVACSVSIFLAIATNVYLAMVVRPRLNYLRMKVGSFDAPAPEDPWKVRFDRLHRRSSAILLLGWAAASAGLVLAP
jgi:uncharacterized membrane protein